MLAPHVVDPFPFIYLLLINLAISGERVKANGVNTRVNVETSYFTQLKTKS